jgi:hypothetical protein
VVVQNRRDPLCRGDIVDRHAAEDRHRHRVGVLADHHIDPVFLDNLVEPSAQLTPPRLYLFHQLAEFKTARMVRMRVHVGKNLCFNLALKVAVKSKIGDRELPLFRDHAERLRVHSGDSEHFVSQFGQHRNPLVHLQRHPVDTAQLTADNCDPERCWSWIRGGGVRGDAVRGAGAAIFTTHFFSVSGMSWRRRRAPPLLI